VPRFRVMLRADSITILNEGRPTEVGFFTTRAVDASSPEQAVEAAKQSVQSELHAMKIQNVQSTELHLEEISNVTWWWRRLRPPAGFTFFPAEEAAATSTLEAPASGSEEAF